MKKPGFKLSNLISLDNFMLSVGLIGQGAAYIQAIKIFYFGSASSISLSANLVTLSSMFCWLTFGIIRKINPLIYSNIFGIIGTSLIIIGFFLYG